MASTRVSPGVYINVSDFSEYAPALGKAAFCVVGGASKGPLNTPTFLTNEADLVDTFGPPLLTDYALQAAVIFLRKGNRLVFVRVAHNAVQATVPVPGLAAGSPATAATGTVSFTGSTNPADGDTVTLHSLRPTAVLNADNVGAAANVALTKTGGNILVTGMTGGTVSTRAVGKVELTAQPADGNLVTISDGVNAAKVFEFDSNATTTGGNIAVTIGGDVYATMANLIAAINGAASLNVAAVAGHQTVVFEFDSNNAVGGGHLGVLIGPNAASSLLNLLAAVNGAVATLGLVAANATNTVPALSLTNTVLGARGNAASQTTGSNIAVTGLSGAVDAVSGSSVNVMAIEALNPGTWGNSLVVTIVATTTIGAPQGNFDVIVKAPVDQSGTLGIVEKFPNLSADSASDRYIADVLSLGISGELGKSRYVLADVLSNAGTVSVGDYALGTAGGAVGDDGVSGLVAADYIGSINGQSATGLKAVRNPEKTTFNIVAVPGVTHKDVIAALIDLAQFRNDCVVILDPPFGATLNQVIDWHNGLGTGVFANAPTLPIDVRQAVLYWSWAQQEDSYSGKTLWLPPSGFAAAAWAFNDQAAGPQFIPAGPNRGGVDAIDVEYSPDQEERDLLLGDQNRVNPLVNFAEGGIELYGNRTLQRKRTALDDIHVQRMLIYAQKLIATSVRFLVFEPNDPITWLKFTALVNPILENLKQGRGIFKFFVLCDASTNPSQQQQNKTMRGIIKIQPVEGAEIIDIDFSLYATGADFNQ